MSSASGGYYYVSELDQVPFWLYIKDALNSFLVYTKLVEERFFIEEGSSTSCNRRGILGSEVAERRRFLWRGNKQFFAATREGMREREGRASGRKPFSRYLSHLSLFFPHLFPRRRQGN